MPTSVGQGSGGVGAGTVPAGVVIDKTPGTVPVSLVALETAVPAATKPATQTWDALVGTFPNYRTARVVGGTWQWADQAGTATTGAEVDVTPATIPASLAALTTAVPPSGQPAGTVWESLYGTAPDYGIARIVGGVWVDSSVGGGDQITVWTPGQTYALGDLVMANGDRLYIADGAHTSTASFAADIGAWREVSRPPNTVFLPNSSVNPVSPGNPTVAEIQAGIAAHGVAVGNIIITYTGTNAAGDPVTRTYWRDPDTLAVVPLGSAGSGGAPMVGATNLANGTGGTVPAPLRNDMGLVLHGDGTWGEVLQQWTPVTPISQGMVILENGVIYRSNLSRTTGPGVFDATEAANWTPVVGARMVGATSTVVGVGGSVPAPPIGTQGLPLHGDATYKGVAPAWAPSTAYSAGQLVTTTQGIYRRKVAGTSGAGTFDATEALQWDLIADVLTGALLFKGGFDASAGAFPGGGLAQPGWFYVATVGGTVNGVTFNAGDELYATTPNASITTYAGNWLRVPAGRVQPYTDTFLAADWVLSGADRILTYPVATHLQGTQPYTWVEALFGVDYDQTEAQITTDPAGNVTLAVPDGNQFDGRVAISAGLGGSTTGLIAGGANAAGTLGGSSGSISAPAAGDNRSVLRGDNTWGNNIPAFEASTFYRAGTVILQAGALYSRNTSGVSGASFAADTANWTAIGGSTPGVVSTTAATFTADPAAASVVIVGNTTGSCAVTLATPTGSNRVVTIKRATASTGAVVTPASGQIEGAASYTLTAQESITAAFDGTNWFVI